MLKNYRSFLLASWRSMTKIAGSGSGSISQRHGSADPDPDPPQNVMDPQHWLPGTYLLSPTFSLVLQNLLKKLSKQYEIWYCPTIGVSQPWFRSWAVWCSRPGPEPEPPCCWACPWAGGLGSPSPTPGTAPPPQYKCQMPPPKNWKHWTFLDFQ